MPNWCLFWAFSAQMQHFSGVERQFYACFWRSAPAFLNVHSWCLNARMLLVLGVQRQIHALFWR